MNECWCSKTIRRSCSNIERLLGQLLVYSLRPVGRIGVVGRTVRALVLVQGRVKVHTASLTNEVGVVCRGAD
jgi:hypothetical protein